LRENMASNPEENPKGFPNKERVAAVRLHLTHKYDDALLWARETQAAVISSLLPATRTAVAAAHTVGDVATRSWETAKDKPELTAGTVVSVAALWWLRGWKTKLAIAATLAASWGVFAPQEVSTLSKGVLRATNALFARGADAVKSTSGKN
jgi:hypothetical protein